MSDLAGFLLARIAEDETAAWAAMQGARRNGKATVRRRLAECEVKRQLVLDAQRIAHPDPLRQGDYWRGVREADRAWIRALALPYADHPDYREEWRR